MEYVDAAAACAAIFATLGTLMGGALALELFRTWRRMKAGGAGR